MTYKAELNQKAKSQWESFKSSISVDREKKIFKEAAFLGNCNVNISFIDGELTFEIMPSETADMDGDVEGVIINIDENNCHLDSILKMNFNARQVENAKKNEKPIKRFNNKGVITIFD
jgi:hypothetical protein